jgi:chromatin segregation and condensation protein Rec8/ScpA/Scc1 (kleisin family)
LKNRQILHTLQPVYSSTKAGCFLPNAVIGEDTPPDTLPYELVEQLLEYKKMQAAALEMRQLEERAQLRLTREAGWGPY